MSFFLCLDKRSIHRHAAKHYHIANLMKSNQQVSALKCLKFKVP